MTSVFHDQLYLTCAMIFCTIGPSIFRLTPVDSKSAVKACGIAIVKSELPEVTKPFTLKKLKVIC